jgi:hypothetical protein
VTFMHKTPYYHLWEVVYDASNGINRSDLQCDIQDQTMTSKHKTILNAFPFADRTSNSSTDLWEIIYSASNGVKIFDLAIVRFELQGRTVTFMHKTPYNSFLFAN